MKLGRRSSAVYEYYHPNTHRKNLSLVIKAITERIVFSNKEANREKVATSIEFIIDGKKYTVAARREIILCAGTIGSPQILELSGISLKSILKKYGIKYLIDNPNVGEHL
jgi:choline dehydrogenase-like flavoprotein